MEMIEFFLKIKTPKRVIYFSISWMMDVYVTLKSLTIKIFLRSGTSIKEFSYHFE